MSSRKKVPDSKARTRERAASPRPEPRRFRPPSALEQPRYAGVPSFLRLPVSPEPESVPAVDVLLCGVPFDGATAFRPGSRFGPRAVREASAFASSFSLALGVDVFDELTAADGGDVAVASADVHLALERMADRADRIARSGAIVGFVGGDQTATLGALRGIRRAKHKAFNLLHIDARGDAAPSPERPAAHSAIRNAVDEGLVRPDATLQVGLRGPFAGADELVFASSHGFELVTIDEVRWDLHAVVSQVRRLVQRGALYVSVDVGVLDPAFAPGTGFPAPGGMSTWELQQILRALVGAEIVGFDLVEIAPDYDHAGMTAAAGVSVLHEILAAIADTRRSARPAPSTRRVSSRGRKLSP